MPQTKDSKLPADNRRNSKASAQKATGSINPDWNWEEVILGLEFYLANTEGRRWRKRIRESNIRWELEQLRKLCGGATSPTCRNENGVYRKIMNFACLDPDSGKNGLEHWNKLDEVAWDTFHGNPEALKKECQSIKQKIKGGARSFNKPPKIPAIVSNEDSAMEGARIEQRTYRRKRDQRLRNAALKNAHGICAVCDVDYSKILDGEGVEVLEVHHIGQLSNLDAPELHTLSDLAVVCANCHALIHKKPKNPLSIKELRLKLSKPA